MPENIIDITFLGPVVFQKVSDYYECSTCEANSLSVDKYCPCPRELNCEAVKIGKTITTIQLIKENKDV
jgi:hypothetical protein